MNDEIVKCCERIGELKARNPNCIMKVNDIYMTPTEWGSDMDATYRLLGMFISTFDEDGAEYSVYQALEEFNDFVEKYVPNLFVPIRDYVIEKLQYPSDYKQDERDKIQENIVGRLTKSVACGATMLQNDRFIEKMQKAINSHTFWDRKY